MSTEKWRVRHPGIGTLAYDSEQEARVAAGTAGEVLAPESPAIQDTDRLREVTARAAKVWALCYPIPAWQLAEGVQADQLAARWGEQIADAVLAAVLSVHRETVLGEVVDALDDRVKDAYIAERMGLAASAAPGISPRWSPPEAAGRVREWKRARNLVRRLAVSAPPTPPGSPPADERATAVETGRGGACCASAAESDGHCHEPGCLYLLGLQTGRAERDRLARELETMTEVARSNRRHVGYLTEYSEQMEADRNLLAIERDRLAETIRRYEPVIEAARALSAAARNSTAPRTPIFQALLDAVAALGDSPAPAVHSVPLDEVLAALRDEDAVNAFAERHGDDLDGWGIEHHHRERLALYLTERFAPAEPEGTPDA